MVNRVTDLSKKTYPGSRTVGRRLFLALLCLLLAPVLAAAPGIEELKNVPARKSISLELEYADLRLATFGDDLAITREFEDGRWVWNKRWNPVQSFYEATGGATTAASSESWVTGHNRIKRNDLTFKGEISYRTGNTPGEHFEKTADSLTWKDKSGNWIKYLPAPGQVGISGGPAMAGYIHSYGNALYTNTFVLDAHNRISQVKDHFGQVVLTFTYLGDTELPTRIEDYSGRFVSYVYSAANQLEQVTDVRGKVWKYGYSQDGARVTSLTDPNGKVTAYTYSSSTITVTLADNLQTHYRYQYDKAKEKFRHFIDGPDGSVREYVYDNSGNYGDNPQYQEYLDGELIQQRFGNELQSRYRDAFGNETVYEKNEHGKTAKVIHSDGTTEEWLYSADGRHQNAYINQNGVRTEWDYDANDRVTESRRAVGLPEQQTVRYSYPDLLTRVVTYLGDAHTGDAITTEHFDQFGNVTAFTDAENNTTTYTYNALGQAKTETRPGPVLYVYEYDAAGNLLMSTDPLSLSTSHSYDDFGNRISTTWPNQAITTFGYNALNQKVSTTNDKNETIKTVYDRVTRSFTMTDAREAVTRVDLNAQGLANKIEDPNGNLTHRRYEKGRLVATQYPTFEQRYAYTAEARLKQVTDHHDGKQATTNFRIDPLGQLLESVDANNNSERLKYDAFGRPTLITDAAGGVTSLQYDVYGNLVKVTDPENRVTRFEYNGSEQVVAEERQPTLGNPSRRSYDYDSRGNLHIELTPKGEKIAYSYNEADELIKVEFFPDTTAPSPVQTVSLGYSILGKLATYDDGETEGAYTYDQLGQLSTATINYGPFSKSISYTYDDSGNVATYTNPENTTYTYTYDNNSQVRSIDIPGLGLVSFNQYQWSQPTHITLPGGSTIIRQYDGMQRLTANKLFDPAQHALMNVLYGYDGIGNVQSQSTEHGRYSYNYDELYRLTRADYPPGNDEVFEYDGTGNRTQYTEGGATYDNRYNDANQLIRRGEDYYQYDPNGHLISKGSDAKGMDPDVRYFYDAQERLVRIEDSTGGVIGRYGYSPLGQRLWKETSGGKTYFLYNRSGLAGEYDSSGYLIKEYHYLISGGWMLSPIFQRDNGSVLFYQTDHLGTPQRMINPSGQVLWSAVYDAFGEATVVDALVSSNLRFPGQYFDHESGLHHNYYRDYAPRIGRYIQSDPIGLRGGLNTYAYTDGNPTNFTDPMGLARWTGTSTAISVVVGGGATRIKYELESDCIDGTYYKATIVAGGPAVGFGAGVAGSVGNIEFDDNNGRVPNPYAFRGGSKYVGISYAFTGVGYQASAVQLGGAVSISHGHQMGYDASVYAGAGVSTITDLEKMSCGCL